MLSVERCRAILGEAAENMTDKQIEKLRERLYHLARLGLDMYATRRVKNELPVLKERSRKLP